MKSFNVHCSPLSLFTSSHNIHWSQLFTTVHNIHNCSQYSQLFTIFTTVQYYAKLTSWHKCSTVQEVMLSSHHQQSIISSSASKEVNRHHQQHLPDLQGVFFFSWLTLLEGKVLAGERGRCWKDSRERLSGRIVRAKWFQFSIHL